MERLRTLIDGPDLVIAPVALNPLMARMAVEAGFKAIYMSGGSLGWVKCGTEATITLSEMAQLALEMRAVSDVPIVLDAGGGWGDPAHIHRTIALTEAAGFDAIEIEDQLLPRRFHHHVGIEHLVPAEFMVAKIKEAVQARSDPNLVIIGRTNSRRIADLDDALRRGEAFHEAGADMIFVHTRNADEMRIIRLALVAGRPGRAGIPSGGVFWFRIRRHVQGCPPVLRLPDRRHDRSAARRRRHHCRNAERAPHRRPRPTARNRKKDDGRGLARISQTP